MTRVSIRAALLLSAVALPAIPAAAEDEPPEAPRPRIELVSDVRIDVEDGGDTNLLAVMSPAGRFMAVCHAPRSDSARRSDSWTRLSLIDLKKAAVTGSWGGLTMGGLPPAFSPEGRLFAWGSRKDATTLQVNVRAVATGRGMGFDVPHAAGSQGFAEVCGVSSNAQRVAIREPADADGNRHLIVYELSKSRQIARYADLAGPHHGGVVLTGPRIALHTRGTDEPGAGDRRLQVVELDTSRMLADRTVFASRTTPGYALAGELLVTGTKDFHVDLVDLASGEARTLIDASDLYSHYLEVVLSADGKRVVAWSDERKLILASDIEGLGDTEGEKPIRVELPYRAHVLGISADGRWAYVRVHDRGIVAVDIDSGSEAGALATGTSEGLADWVRITPDGAFLVEGVRDDKGWTFAIFAIKTP